MRMPAIFVGHGSPMNAIQTNAYTEAWQSIGQRFKPKAILVISGHWYTDGLLIQNTEDPEKINDMYGFPEALYQVSYPVRGDGELTKTAIDLLGNQVRVSNDWGIDHGTWAVLTHMYPDADIPVVQLSVDRNRSTNEHFKIGEALYCLREQGYMILASGNVVHNLRMMNPGMQGGYEWAQAFDGYIEGAIRRGDYDLCLNYMDFGDPAQLSVPTQEHYLPLLTVLGAAGDADRVEVFNKGFDLGGVSMTGYIFTDE